METQVDIIFDVRVMLWVMFHAYACKDAQNICATMACERLDRFTQSAAHAT